MLSILGIGVANPKDIAEKLTPTLLGAKALTDALQVAGIQKESLGLIIGDSSTPFETCPSEGQRIAGNLGLKIPSYDIVGGINSLPIFLDQISKWVDAKTPDYVAFISTNLPSDMLSDNNSEFFSDSAGAVIVSTRIKGRLNLKTVKINRNNGTNPAIKIARRLTIEPSLILNDEELLKVISDGITFSNEEFGERKVNSYLITPPFFGKKGIELAEKLGFPASRIIPAPMKPSFSLGSTLFTSIYSALPSLNSGDALVMLSCLDNFENSITIFTIS